VFSRGSISGPDETMAVTLEGEGVDSGSGGDRGRAGRWALAVGLLAATAVILTLGGPGLTVDEPLDVRPGRAYWSILKQTGLHFLDPEVVDRVYRDNAEHPPLGRWLLGLASIVGEPFEVLVKGPDPTGSYVLAGRLAPALVFGTLVGLVTGTAAGRWGLGAGLSAGFAMVAMPRVFAHAHFGALDTFLAGTWTAALLAGDRALGARRPARAMAAAGAVWALALLTKIHAWFLLPILAIRALARLSPGRAGAALAAWCGTGIALYFAGWPWLWYHTGPRLLAYWGTGVERATIRVQYFGQFFADRDVPWHYPWVYFATTVPVGLQVLGAIGVVRGWKLRRQDPLPLLLAGSILFFLLLFSTRVPVYDGERLFLHVFPAWALLVGLGFGRLLERASGNRLARRGLVALLVAQGIGVVTTYPFGLSYYNLLVGGLAGAERLGMEVTYWSDAVDDVLLNQLAAVAKPDATAAVIPTLYPGQGILTTGFNRTLARRGIVLQDDASWDRAEWVVVSYRTAYWPPAWRRRRERGEGRLVADRRRQGVRLSALWHFPRELPSSP
jgi:4-amino-4-deoxy-L-arabinose transferase-like glycosyltransferase